MEMAIYGGAFNPPHVGHLMVVQWILSTRRAERVLLVPSASHPFGKDMAPFEQRVAMCQALAQEIPGVTVSRMEAELPSPNYSINLLRALRPRYPHYTLRFVMGADNLAAREKWFGFEDIEREFNPIFVGRAGVQVDHDIASPMFPDVSSTEIRRRLAAGEPVDHLVPAVVMEVLNRAGATSS